MRKGKPTKTKTTHRRNKKTPSIQIHDPLTFLKCYTLIKGGGFKLVIWTQTYPLNEMMCAVMHVNKYHPHSVIIKN